jgi:hypothetical protein
MRRVAEESTEMPGQDSFLDVFANIVGILILLVMVLGVRATYAVDPVENAGALEDDAPALVSDDDVREARQEAAGEEREFLELIRQAREMREERLLREQERAMLVTFVAAAEREMSDRRAELSQQQQSDLDIRQQLAAAQMALDTLSREKIALLSQEPEVIEIECGPTPLATAVKGKEVHLQLANRHVAIVPLDEFIEQLEQHIPQNLWRLRDQDELVMTIGPKGGFRLRYFIEKVRVAMPNGSTSGMVVGQAPVFSRGVLIPVSDPLGEPVDQAVLPNSELRRHLSQFNPQTTTITVWTYPGNYRQLQQLRKWVRELGFQTATWPREAGDPIAFSPSGKQSLAD